MGPPEHSSTGQREQPPIVVRLELEDFDFETLMVVSNLAFRNSTQNLWPCLTNDLAVSIISRVMVHWQILIDILLMYHNCLHEQVMVVVFSSTKSCP